MAVLLETSKGDIVIDLYVDETPNTCKNFLKLCKLKYYNNCIFHNVQRNFIAQTGDPSGTGKGGESVYGLMYGSQARFFDDEISPKRKHAKRGAVGMASAGPGLNASQFYITLGDALDSLDEKHTLFGQVSEGLEVLEAMSEVPVDSAGRPMQNIRIRHAILLDDPFDDPPQLADLMPDASPAPQFEQGGRLEEDWVPVEDERPAEEIEKESREAEARNRAVVLEMIGDLPEAEAKPPSNMLFICKLNPVTTEEDLEIIFSRFGNVTSCDIIRDFKTGDSLCYGFIGYDNDAACEAAYFKMNNVLIDDRRIRVDFSQSVSHIWKQFKRHGKRGGTTDMAAEAAGHERGRVAGDARFERREQPQQGSRGMLLFDHHDAQLLQQQQQAGRGAGDERLQRRWDAPTAPAAAAGGGGGKRSRSRSHGRARGRSRSQSSSRSRSRSRDGGGKKHKKQKKEKHKKETAHKHRSREHSRDRAAAAADSRAQLQQHPGGRKGHQQREEQRDEGRRRGREGTGNERAGSRDGDRHAAGHERRRSRSRERSRERRYDGGGGRHRDSRDSGRRDYGGSSSRYR
ncbi:peptidylprolyl isomerase-like protein [Scenedesmus sp. NREL 46B-D3]|nr:peptidylprolyl isomerase-like protein [Scenedesmus sp. NREL 46B-D3]